MVLELSQAVVDGLDWAVLGVAGALWLLGAVGAILCFQYSSTLSKKPVAREYNFLWRARALTSILVAVLALSSLLRLQVLFGPSSVLVAGGYFPSTFCRAYIASTYGVFEPAFLLLGLFACMYSVKGRDSTKHPNFNIVLFAAGFSLPSCAAQIVAALFTRIFELDYAGKRVLRMLFATDASLGEHCLNTAMMANCAFCVFPLLSTFISIAFSGIYLAAFGWVTQRMAATVINKLLVRRLRVMQCLVMSSMATSLACRGCTVLFEPFELGFELLRVAHLLCLVGCVLTLSWFLVLRPVYDTHTADRALREFARKGNSLPDPLLANPLGFVLPPQELHTIESSTGGSIGQASATEEGCGNACDAGLR